MIPEETLEEHLTVETLKDLVFKSFLKDFAVPYVEDVVNSYGFTGPLTGLDKLSGYKYSLFDFSEAIQKAKRSYD